MTKLLHITSRVKAAVEAYNSVQDFTDPKVWKENFDEELVSVHLYGI